MATVVGAEDCRGSEVGGLYQHHAQQTVCASRAKYREGRRPRAVKVYTVNLESRYLLIQGVPALGVMKELVEQFALYGTIEEYNPLDDYPAEEFTEVYLIKFLKIQSARIAKRKLDERSFFGSLLHVCYAPEFESVQETRNKLKDRRKYIAKATSGKEQLLEIKQDSGILSSEIMQLDTSGLWTSETTISKWSPGPHTHSPWQSSSCTLSLRNVASSSEDCCQGVLMAPRFIGDCAETSSCFSKKTIMGQRREQRVQNTSACWNLERRELGDKGLGRFMPRTTQLQERKRRRDEDNKLALLGGQSDVEEIIIGPRRPEIPKTDMHDESLNASANLIRRKLKEISVPVQTSNTSDESSEKNHIKPIIKQRRRI